MIRLIDNGDENFSVPGSTATNPESSAPTPPQPEEKPRVAEVKEPDLSTIKLSDEKIKSVVAALASQAEQMMKGYEANHGVNAEEIANAVIILSKLDAALTEEKEALLDESPFKKLAEIASQMNESNRAMLLEVIDQIKQKTFDEIKKRSQESQITDKPLDLQAALDRRLNETAAVYDVIQSSKMLNFSSLAELDNFLMNMLGVNYQTIKNNRGVWSGDGMTRINSKKIPGLVISIYDRVVQGYKKSEPGKEYNVDIGLAINSESEPRPLKAAILDSFEDKKSRENE